MMKKLRIILLSFILIALFLPSRIALADTGPKPTMEFQFKQELPEGEVQIVSGILYECDQPDCSDAAPLQPGGPQGFFCDPEGCRALAYGFAPYHQLEIEFSDGTTRHSNIFKTAGFDSKYTVTVRPDDLLVEAQFSLGILSPATWILIVCACILVIGAGLIGLIVFLIRRSRKT
jgi:hypothetical protein